MINTEFKNKLHIVDDDEQTCLLLKTVTEVFIQVQTYQEGKLFLQQPLSDHDIILLDLMMPDIDGIEIMRVLSDRKVNAIIILMSGYDLGVLHSSLKLAQEYGLNVVDHITKPIDLDKLVEKITNIQRHNALLLPSFLNAQHNIDKQNTVQKAHDSAIFKPTINDLEHAINQREFILYYQPQIEIKTKKLIGFEALIRWQHPVHGLIFPDNFIPLAENSRLMIELTAEVINLAIKQTKVWQKKELHYQISINISAQNITSLTLPEQLTTLVNENKIDPGMLKLEVTETALMTELTTSLDILTRLRLKGFYLSIDDFGTGYSSLSLLNRIPFTELKIDQSFVMSMIDSDESKAIVETCILLGHKLNMKVIAEGVENKNILDSLEEMGCDDAQGYYLAKPMSAIDAEHWVKTSLPYLK